MRGGDSPRVPRRVRNRVDKGQGEKVERVTKYFATLDSETPQVISLSTVSPEPSGAPEPRRGEGVQERDPEFTPPLRRVFFEVNPPSSNDGVPEKKVRLEDIQGWEEWGEVVKNNVDGMHEGLATLAHKVLSGTWCPQMILM